MTSVNNSNRVRVNPERAEVEIQSERAIYTVDPPPPYSFTDRRAITSAITNQPVIHQTIIIQPTFKSGPTFFNCPRCNERVLTKVKYENSKSTHMLAGFICGFTCWCLLCCLAAIPYVVPTFKKAEHYCPQCETLLGVYSKI